MSESQQIPMRKKELEAWEEKVNKEIIDYLARHKGDQYDQPTPLCNSAATSR